MPELPQPDEWSSWIIGTLVTVISTAIATIVGLAKLIQSIYLSRINQLETNTQQHKVEIEQLKKESAECQKDRYNLAIRVASLEAGDSTSH